MIFIVPCFHKPHASSLNLTDGSKTAMYADNILLFHPIDHPDAYMQ